MHIILAKRNLRYEFKMVWKEVSRDKLPVFLACTRMYPLLYSPHVTAFVLDCVHAVRGGGGGGGIGNPPPPPPPPLESLLLIWREVLRDKEWFLRSFSWSSFPQEKSASFLLYAYLISHCWRNQPLVADSMLDECPSSNNRKERLVLFQLISDLSCSCSCDLLRRQNSVAETKI